MTYSIMTWLIFCSLAFCIFQIVFADKLAEHIAALNDPSTVTMTDDNGQAYAAILDVADTVKSKEINSGQIYNKCTSMPIYADKKFYELYDAKTDKCQQCYHKAKNTKDIEAAENCCKKVAEEFKKDVKTFITQAKTCIADLAQKCAKSATYCRKEAANADKAHEKLMLEMGKKDAERNRIWRK